VRDSVLLHRVVVHAGAVVNRCVVDADVVVEAGAHVGRDGEGDVTVIGRES